MRDSRSVEQPNLTYHTGLHMMIDNSGTVRSHSQSALSGSQEPQLPNSPFPVPESRCVCRSPYLYYCYKITHQNKVQIKIIFVISIYCAEVDAKTIRCIGGGQRSGLSYLVEL